MKLSSWTAAALATPAIATGVCLWTASTAQAAPDDTGSSSASASSDSAASTSSSDDTSTDSKQRSGRDAKRDDDKGDKADTDVKGGKTDDADADDADDDSDEKSASGAHFVPPSTRETSSESLVTIDTAALVEDDDEPVADDDPDVPVDDDDDPADPVDDDDDTDTVQLAIDQLDQAREDLYAATWGDGNFLAGLAAILPQMMLGGAQTNLERWMDNHARLQQEFVDTLNNPFANAIIRMRIENSINRTMRAQDQMDLAEKLVPVVGWFGPSTAAAQIAALIDEASDNGLVYEILDMDLQYRADGYRVRTETVVYISINGGDPVPVLLDSGSLGLVIDPQYVGTENIGSPTGPRGEASYGDGSVVTYYHPYGTTVTVGDDITSGETTVLIVDLESTYSFEETNGGYRGVLGVGPNAGGPGAVNPFAALPGLLGRGVLIDERRRRVILGPNPYAARVELDGAPSTPLLVKVGDYDPKYVNGFVDTGGIFGSIPDYVVDGAPNVPVGTLISVYTEDGETLLYSYRTTSRNSPDVLDTEADDRFNTGYMPFSQTTVYFDYSGDGKTVFNYR